MKYMNKRTGAIIEVASVINGEHWEKVEENKEEVKTQEPEEETTVEVDEETSEEPEEETTVEVDEETSEEPEEEVKGLDDITKKDIMQELDAMGIEYNPKDTKPVLYDLMMKGD